MKFRFMRLGALALAFGLTRTYGGRGRWLAPSSIALLSLSLLLTTAALVGQRAYGVTADARAVLAWKSGTLRSIPTEADTTQKTTPLAAGSVAIVDNTYLGWVRLSFENGQTGWVRKEDVVWFWR